ncbi:helix-turn-helix transcriptional regulator [Streptomyces sp. ODS05-4]|uniref:helix-turn-helix domain-containing protein n=1 Tax=Streptomyces sp. ODS05-4 TaxID=2944939 RepID=UPI00210E0247|nr:helix-turn-helix transcriptional regulator [Streptomyces sp. ODS05-4]
MARPESHLNRDGTPRRELALALRDLRRSRGLTYAQMASRCAYSTSALQEAAAGRKLATLPLTLAFVEACSGDVETWTRYWNDLRRIEEQGASVPAGHPAPHQRSPDTVVPRSASAPTSRRLLARLPVPTGSRRWWAALTACALLALGAWAGVTALTSEQHAADGDGSADFARVVVQNKVAIGPGLLVEDATQIYLSTKAVSRCRVRGCMLHGTQMSSGAQLVADCWLRGENLTNADITSEGIERNTNRVSSDRWYRVKWKDGRVGHISEVYLEPTSRGGLRLEPCRPDAASPPR